MKQKRSRCHFLACTVLVSLALMLSTLGLLEPHVTLLEDTADFPLNTLTRKKIGMDFLYNNIQYRLVPSRTKKTFLITIYSQNDIVSQHIKKTGSWDNGATFLMKTILESKSGPHQVVDFGTHVGWFSLYAASLGHKSIGIEAMTSNYEAILLSREVNGFELLIELHNNAISDYNSEANSVICVQSRTAGSNIGNGQIFRNEKNCDEKVDLASLDDIVNNRNIIYMKADCEGCEGGALLSGRKLFRTNPPCSVFIEWRPDHVKNVSNVEPLSVITMLVKSGYFAYFIKAHPITGVGLELTAILHLDSLATKGGDLILFHDSDRCFPRKSSQFQYILNEIESLKGLDYIVV